MNTGTLRMATGLLLVAWAAHTADHLRRGLTDLDAGVITAGTLAAMLIAVLATLVFTGHPIAPWAAAAIGGAVAVGVSASHFLPEWGELSDPLTVTGIDALTWIAVIAEVGAAAFVGAIGLSLLRQTDFAFARA